MSGIFRQRSTCDHCGNLTSTEDDFGKWSRAKCGQQLSVQDVDYIFHRFMTSGNREVQVVMMVETKTKSADMDAPQRDTFMIFDQLLRTHPRRRERDANGRLVKGHSENPVKVPGLYGARRVKAYGVHKVRMDGTHPGNSTWITWDNKKINEQILIKLLRFELHPDSLRPMDCSRPHKKKRLPKMLF